MLIGVPGCKSKRHQTKYGPPPTNYDQTITKYGVLINEDDMKPDTTYNPTITKYGVPIDYDVTPIDSTMVKPENNNN